jgi:hypothetical protein
VLCIVDVNRSLKLQPLVASREGRIRTRTRGIQARSDATAAAIDRFAAVLMDKAAPSRERLETLELIEGFADRAVAITHGADKGYDAPDFMGAAAPGVL